MSIQHQTPTPKRRTRPKAAPKETKDAQIARLQAQLAATQARLLSVEAEARAGNGLPAYSDTQLLHELEDRNIPIRDIVVSFDAGALINAIPDDGVCEALNQWTTSAVNWGFIMETASNRCNVDTLASLIVGYVDGRPKKYQSLWEALEPLFEPGPTDIMHLADHADMGRWDVVCDELKRMISEAKFGS
jgi:hypothetical protein